MGEVYRARDNALKRDVAIKVLPVFWSGDPERLRRFEVEAQATAALNHPNIVSIFHVGKHNGAPYIVTELLQGDTLRDRLRKGPMRLREVLDFGAEPMAFRVRLADHSVETITSLKGLPLAIGPGANIQFGVAPDGSPVFTRDTGTQEIYALTVKWP
jgi:hypothetical protein